MPPTATENRMRLAAQRAEESYMARAPKPLGSAGQLVELSRTDAARTGRRAEPHHGEIRTRRAERLA